MLLEPTLSRALPLRNDEAELRRMSQWFRQLAAEIGLDPAQTDDLELCLNELAANVLRHACREGESREIRVLADGDAERLRLTVEDDGPAFDPREEPPPARPETLGDAGIGGWGLPIVRALAGAMLYERRDGRNRVTITPRAAPVSGPGRDTI